MAWEQNGTTTVLNGTPDADPNNVTIVVPGSLLVTPGTAHITLQTICALGGVIPTHGQSDTVNFTIDPPAAPTLTSVSPGGGTQNQTVHVTLTGTNFVAGATVTVSGTGITVQNVAVVNGTTITADFVIAPTATAGLRDVTVTTTAGSAKKTQAFNVIAASGPLTISPATLPVGTVTKPYLPTTGTTDTTLAATGGNPPYRWTLVSNASSTPPPGLGIDTNTGVISGTPTTIGTFTFTAQVTDSTAPTALTASGSFGITVGTLVPHITSINPTTAVVNDPAFTTLTVNGTDFASGAVVKLGNTSLVTTFVNSTQLTAAISAVDKATVGSQSVQVINPVPVGGSASPENVMLTLTGPLPVITSLSPPSATIGGPTFTLTVNGGNFQVGAFVRWNGVDHPTNFVSPTQLTAQIFDTDIATATTATVTVFNPDFGLSNAVSFPVNSSLLITTPSLPQGAISTAYTKTLNAVGGTPPYMWSAAGLPTGLGVTTNADNTGTVSGTVARAGEFSVLVTVKDSGGGVASAGFALLVPCVLHTSGAGPANENGNLVGPFVFRFSGFDATGHAVARVGKFVADGNTSATTNNAFGSLTAGHEDIGSVTANGGAFTQADILPSSTYCIGNNQGRLEGTLTLRTPTATSTSSVTYAVTVSGGNPVFGTLASASIIEFDPVDKVRGTGIVAQQVSSLGIVPGNYVFGMTGRDSVNGPASVAGVFNVDATLKGTTGEDDFNDPAFSINVVNNNPIAVTLTGQPDANGRTTGTLTAGSNATATGEIDFVLYAVHPFEFFVLSNGSGLLPATAVPILSGEIFRQILPQPLDARNLNTSSIFYVASSAAMEGFVLFNGNANSPGSNGLILNFEFDTDIAGTISGPITTTTGTYSVAPDGRATITPSGVNFSSIAYLSDRNAGVLLDPTPGAGLGQLFRHIFVLSNQPAFGIINTVPPFVDSTVATGFATQLSASTLNWNLDVDSPFAGLTFDFKSPSPLPFTAMDSLNARYTVGNCPPGPSDVCLVGYGTYSGSSAFDIGNLLLDETGRTTTPAILFGASIPITAAPVAPVFLSPTSTTFKEAAVGLFRVTASGTPAPTFSESGALPSGVFFDSATGTLSGTPASGTAGAGPGLGGSYPITFKASNGFPPDASQSFTLNVNAASATLAISTKSLAGSPATVGSPYSALVSAMGGNSPFTWIETTATQLFDPATGLGKSGACTGLKLDFTSNILTLPISGTPTISGFCGPFTLQIQDSSTPRQTANSLGLSIFVN